MSSTFASDKFHRGEIAVQTRAGAREIADQVGRIIRDAMPDQHRSFFSQLPYVVLGSLDDDGYPRASFVSSEPGFITSPDPKTLVVGALPFEDDPALCGLEEGRPIAVLGIELHTRRRNRANGVVTVRRPDGITIHVRESFGNCPKYIVPRAPLAGRPREAGTSVAMGPTLSVRAKEIVRKADTAFIASAHHDGDRSSMDVSHRGGAPGFVHLERDGDTTKLVIPDYSGNHLHMTLGNLHESPRAGLLLVDFDRGDALSLTADAALVWNDAAATEAWGAERLLELRVASAVLLEGAIRFSWRRLSGA